MSSRGEAGCDGGATNVPPPGRRRAPTEPSEALWGVAARRIQSRRLSSALAQARATTRPRRRRRRAARRPSSLPRSHCCRVRHSYARTQSRAHARIVLVGISSCHACVRAVSARQLASVALSLRGGSLLAVFLSTVELSMSLFLPFSSPQPKSLPSADMAKPAAFRSDLE